MAHLSEVQSGVESLPAQERKAVAIQAASNLSVEDKQDVVEALLGKPDQPTTNTIWVIVVSAFVVVFVGAFLSIAYLYISNSTNVDRGGDKLLTIFTTVTAFLAGLLAPSPLKK